MSAIEVLKKEKELYLGKIKDINRANETRPEDIAEMYKKSIKIYEEFISALDEALLALEKQEKLKEWLEKEIELRKIKHDCIAKQAYKSSEDLFRIGELETEVTSLKEVLERVGEQK
jgi:predicted Holliday junction resolvase-like endonuclease